MGKSIKNVDSSVDEKHSNQSKQQKKGAPHKTQPISKENFWFYEKKAIKLIQKLAEMGQLQFKIQSGTVASELKEHYQTNFGKRYENELKKERKSFIKAMTKNLTQLYKKLQLNGNLNHYFLSQSSQYEFQISTEKKVLLPIHEDFTQSLNLIQQILQQNDQSQKKQKLTELIDSIKNKDEHKFLQKWALTKAWMQSGIGILQNLQQINQDYDYSNQRNDIFATKEYFKELQQKTCEELKNHFQSQINSHIEEFLTALDSALNEEQQD